MARRMVRLPADAPEEANGPNAREFAQFIRLSCHSLSRSALRQVHFNSCASKRGREGTRCTMQYECKSPSRAVAGFWGLAHSDGVTLRSSRKPSYPAELVDLINSTSAGACNSGIDFFNCPEMVTSVLVSYTAR